MRLDVFAYTEDVNFVVMSSFHSCYMFYTKIQNYFVQLNTQIIYYRKTGHYFASNLLIDSKTAREYQLLVYQLELFGIEGSRT